jgi:hypothetical protein
VKLVDGTSEPVCQFEIDQLEEMFARRWFGWLTTPPKTIWTVRAGHALQERRHMFDLIETRPVPGAFTALSLGDELSAAICDERGRAAGDKCTSDRLRAEICDQRRQKATDECRVRGTVWSGAPLPGMPRKPQEGWPGWVHVDSAASLCADLRGKLPTLPLGWTLGSLDKKWMSCLSIVGAQNVRAQLARADAVFRNVEERSRQAEQLQQKAASESDRGKLAASP